MVTDNVTLMQMARESLKGKWGLAIGTFIVYIVIVGAMGAIPRLGPILSLIFTGPFVLGITYFSLSLSRGEDARVEQLFDGFKHFLIALAAYLMMAIFIFLWMLLLIVPGIIAGIAYSMTFFILADNEGMGAAEAMNISKDMMFGHKLRYFYLCIRFFGLALLCILTLGIGFFWLLPYIQVTTAKFYDDLKANYVPSEEPHSIFA